MKRLLVGLLGLLAACQSAPPTITTAPPPAGPTASAAAPAEAAPPVSAAALAMLRQYNLAPLWANQAAGGQEENPRRAMEGFYGQQPYRISFFFQQVTRDARQPNLFYVVGLDRYRKIITPFTGTITVQAIQPFTDKMAVDAPDSTARAYTAVGKFELREDPATKGAGTYFGKALLDFYVDSSGRLDQAGILMSPEFENPTKGCGLLFDGYQVSNQTGRRQPVAFANFYGVVVPQALRHLGLGDRSEEVNPNLARLGWNQAWENEEWWADSPKPSLSL